MYFNLYEMVILSCEKQGGIYHYLFKNGKFTFVEKTSLDRPMYAIIRDNKMYVILREIDTKTHFGGILSFDIAENGKLINPTRDINIIGDYMFSTNELSDNVTIFKICDNGTLAKINTEIEVPYPVCILSK